MFETLGVGQWVFGISPAKFFKQLNCGVTIKATEVV